MTRCIEGRLNCWAGGALAHACARVCACALFCSDRGAKVVACMQEYNLDDLLDVMRNGPGSSKPPPPPPQPKPQLQDLPSAPTYQPKCVRVCACACVHACASLPARIS